MNIIEQAQVAANANGCPVWIEGTVLGAHIHEEPPPDWVDWDDIIIVEPEDETQMQGL